MSRDGSGNYSLPLPPVVTGTTIEATWANTTLDDIKTALTDSLSRSGNGGMSAQIKLIDGSVTVPSLGWTSEANSGLYRAAANDLRFTVNGVDQMRWTTANGVQIFSGAWKKVGFSSLVKFDDSGGAVGGVFTQADADQFTVFAAGTGQGAHGQFKAYSGTHSTLPGQVEFGSSSAYCRFDPATGKLQVPTAVTQSADNSTLVVDGGNPSTSGARLELYGPSHATKPYDFNFVTNLGNVMSWDNATTSMSINGSLTTVSELTGFILLGSTNSYIRATAANRQLVICGGTNTTSDARIELAGPSHANFDQVRLRKKVLMPDLPTSDPLLAGQLWNDAGTLKVSAG